MFTRIRADYDEKYGTNQQRTLRATGSAKIRSKTIEELFSFFAPLEMRMLEEADEFARAVEDGERARAVLIHQGVGTRDGR